EAQLHTDLNTARLEIGRAPRCRNLADSAAGQRRIRITEQHEIRHVEHFRAKLQFTLLVEVRDLGDTYVDVGSGRSAERISAEGAVCALRRIVHRIKSLSGGQ